MTGPTVLVVAKAPVAGAAKTRIAADVGAVAAADVSAAALLDTLETAIASGQRVVVALIGDLQQAARPDELRRALAELVVVPQVGASFGARLARAHLDADDGHGVVQVGMDTPQLRAEDLSEAADRLADHPSVLGPATDGGWWLLGVRDGSDASVLAEIEMSTSDTGEHTRAVLPQPTALLRILRDVDTWADARALAAEIPDSRLGAAVRAISDRIRV